MKIPMKKILMVLDEHSIERLDKIVKHLNDCPEEGGGWNRSRAIRIMIYQEHEKMFQHKQEKGQ